MSASTHIIAPFLAEIHSWQAAKLASLVNVPAGMPPHAANFSHYHLGFSPQKGVMT